jgi:hypothetical protein
LYPRIYPVAYINPSPECSHFFDEVDHDNIVNPSEGELLIDEINADLVSLKLQCPMNNASLRFDLV